MNPPESPRPIKSTRPWTAQAALAAIDPTTPSVARVYDYLLGGKDNFPVDRDFAADLVDRYPAAARVLWANRAFLGRAVRHLAETGIDQFLDIGTGLPTVDNVHQIAHRVHRKARVVYIDCDPLVVTHAQALLAGDPATTAAVHGDLRDPRSILDHPDVRRLIDFDSPVAIMLVAVLHFLGPEDRPYERVGTLTRAMTQGSHLVISHVVDRPEVREAAACYDQANEHGYPRDETEIAAFFDGMELVDPEAAPTDRTGLVPVDRWRPGFAVVDMESGVDTPILAGVGRR